MEESQNPSLDIVDSVGVVPAAAAAYGAWTNQYAAAAVTGKNQQLILQ